MKQAFLRKTRTLLVLTVWLSLALTLSGCGLFFGGAEEPAPEAELVAVPTFTPTPVVAFPTPEPAPTVAATVVAPTPAPPVPDRCSRFPP